jgi:hypothetical protein
VQIPVIGALIDGFADCWASRSNGLTASGAESVREAVTSNIHDNATKSPVNCEQVTCQLTADGHKRQLIQRVNAFFFG